MTKAIITLVGPVDLVRFERMRNSYYGNPRFELITTDHGTFRTAPDAAVSYDVENWFGRFETRNRHAAMLHLDGRGNVTNITEATS